jgi:hypothetical protein
MGMTKVGLTHFFVFEDNSPSDLGGEGGSFSNGGGLAGGPGTYQMIIFKTDVGADSYEGFVSCTLADGQPFNPPLPAVPQQNQ